MTKQTQSLDCRRNVEAGDDPCANPDCANCYLQENFEFRSRSRSRPTPSLANTPRSAAARSTSAIPAVVTIAFMPTAFARSLLAGGSQVSDGTVLPQGTLAAQVKALGAIVSNCIEMAQRDGKKWDAACEIAAIAAVEAYERGRPTEQSQAPNEKLSALAERYDREVGSVPCCFAGNIGHEGDCQNGASAAAANYTPPAASVVSGAESITSGTSDDAPDDPRNAVLASRWRAGETIYDLADDYGIPTTVAETIIRRIVTEQALHTVSDDVRAKLLDLHKPYGVWEECEHKHDGADGAARYIDDVGLTCNKVYDICRECCTEGGEGQREVCADGHNHGPNVPRCATVAILNG